MKLIHEKFERDGKGSVKCTPETEDDMWDLYNLLKLDDIVHATATRKVKASEMEASSGGNGTRDTSSKVIKLTLGVKVTNIDWDPDLSLVRVSGQNQTVSEYVKQGAMHTLELTTHKAVTIEKSEWDGEDVRRFRKALEPNVQATIAAMLISDVGECRIALCGGARTTVVAKIERSIPKKKGVGAVVGHEKQLGKFYDDICDAVLGGIGSGHATASSSAAAAATGSTDEKKKKHFLENCNCFVIAGPGFGKENILQRLNERAQKLYSGKSFESWLKSSFDCVLVKNVRASSAHVGALLEALKDPSTRKAVGAAAETLDADVLEQLYAEIEKYKALYGPSHVLKAFKEGAIKMLLLSDDVFRTKDPIERKLWTKVREEVENSGFGSARVFSTGHESGERLKQLTGVAAILRFPMEELIESELPNPPDFKKWLEELSDD
jgi:protein pelota